MTELAEPGVSPGLSPGVSPGLNLDRRQRAMLKEMGVQVWQPLPKAKAAAVTLAAPVATPAVTPAAIDSGAARAYIQRDTATSDTQKQSFQVTEKAPRTENTPSSAWRIGKLQTLYAESAVESAVKTGARWLILIESPASALHDSFNPFEGDAGKLLDNMLRAARLHTAGTAMLAPLVRTSPAGGDLAQELAELLASVQPSVVLVMGRLAAQALLQSAEPLARLRGQVHRLHGAQTIITLDPAYLLRNPLDKAKAWDDLCLAISVV
jgi:DNA polymerase